MQVRAVLHEMMGEVCAEMHAARRGALEAMVWAALEGRCLTVTGLGRAMNRAALEKHCIKRADRLLSNGHLHGECAQVYGVLVRWLVGGQKHPVILVDWSDLDKRKRHQILRASLVVAGRALTLYEEVHSEKTAVKARTHQGFVERLQRMLPPGCVPVLVTDAGFCTPWFRIVERLKWYWVARIRHCQYVQFEGEEWQSCKRLCAQGSTVPRPLGEVSLTRASAHRCRLVLYKRKSKGRHQLNCYGERARSRYSEKHAARAREPCLLATNLPAVHFLARKVVRIYRARMQIEEAFRDLKSARFGLALEYHRTRFTERLAVLLLIAALALVVLWLIGTVARERGIVRHYQANTERQRTVLSAVFVAVRIIERGRETFSMLELATAWQNIAALNAQCWGNEQ